MLMVIFMALVVNLCLLYAAGKRNGGTTSVIRLFMGAIFSAFLTGLSLLPNFEIAKHWLWRGMGLLLAGGLAFGFSWKSWWNILLFVILHASLGGITENGITFSMLLGSAGMGLACLLLGKNQNLIPVELTYGKQTLQLTALRDTGHSLKDPISGKSVLILSADAAQHLTGLGPRELRDPVGTMQSVSGLRLIPYQTVGNKGFLLAIFVSQAKIGTRQGSAVVALSPNVFGSHYQALTGGN